jgi:predicted glycosyltransferase
MKVMFYVQHLLGIGHLVRASRVAEALHQAGHHVTMVSGGMPVEGFPGEGVNLLQLPPLRSADAGFSSLADGHGNEVSEGYLSVRQRTLLAAFDTICPDCLVIEAFPFARRQMRFELLPLLAHVDAFSDEQRPMVASSIRDILQPKSVARDQATADLVRRHFDLVLVHGDENFAPLSETFSAADMISDRVAYTGLVGPAINQKSDETYDVVVSAGGGAVGQALLEASIEARALTSFNRSRWLIITGPNLPENALQKLLKLGDDEVNIVRFRPDLAALLGNTTVSISQAGYNTVADILSAGCASVLVPFAGGGEREQTTRATRLAQAGACVMIDPQELSPEGLAKAIDQAAVDRQSQPGHTRLDGARQTARILGERHASFRRGQSA